MNRERDAAANHARAWLLLDGVLALHVTDEALTGFLDFYNPLILRFRETLGWFPMPTFEFGVWLTGLILLIVALALLAPVVRRKRPLAIALSLPFAVIMLGNGLAHLAASAYFRRWVPGATTAPLLLAAGFLLLRRSLQRARALDNPESAARVTQ